MTEDSQKMPHLSYRNPDGERYGKPPIFSILKGKTMNEAKSLMIHPDDNLLLEYSNDGLEREVRSVISKHLLICRSCAEKIVELDEAQLEAAAEVEERLALIREDAFNKAAEVSNEATDQIVSGDAAMIAVGVTPEEGIKQFERSLEIKEAHIRLRCKSCGSIVSNMMFGYIGREEYRIQLLHVLNYMNDYEQQELRPHKGVMQIICFEKVVATTRYPCEATLFFIERETSPGIWDLINAGLGLTHRSRVSLKRAIQKIQKEKETNNA